MENKCLDRKKERMRQHLLCCILCLFKHVVAPDCAVDNPWNSEDVTSFYERFDPFEFNE